MDTSFPIFTFLKEILSDLFFVVKWNGRHFLLCVLSLSFFFLGVSIILHVKIFFLCLINDFLFSFIFHFHNYFSVSKFFQHFFSIQCYQFFATHSFDFSNYLRLSKILCQKCVTGNPFSLAWLVCCAHSFMISPSLWYSDKFLFIH